MKCVTVMNVNMSIRQKVTDVSSISSTPKRRHAEKRYYQYQGFMSGIELLENLIHNGVGQIRDHRQLHFPVNKKKKKR